MRINLILCLLFVGHFSFGQQLNKETVLAQLSKANQYWQSHHKPEVWAFWDQAAIIPEIWNSIRFQNQRAT